MKWYIYVVINLLVLCWYYKKMYRILISYQAIHWKHASIEGSNYHAVMAMVDILLTVYLSIYRWDDHPKKDNGEILSPISKYHQRVLVTPMYTYINLSDLMFEMKNKLPYLSEYRFATFGNGYNYLLNLNSSIKRLKIQLMRWITMREWKNKKWKKKIMERRRSMMENHQDPLLMIILLEKGQLHTKGNNHCNL